MFSGASAFNQPVASSTFSGAHGVTSLKDVFSGAQSFNQDLSAWNVSAVRDFTSAFEHANALRVLRHATSSFSIDQEARHMRRALNSWVAMLAWREGLRRIVAALSQPLVRASFNEFVPGYSSSLLAAASLLLTTAAAVSFRVAGQPGEVCRH